MNYSNSKLPFIGKSIAQDQLCYDSGKSLSPGSFRLGGNSFSLENTFSLLVSLVWILDMEACV